MASVTGTHAAPGTQAVYSGTTPLESIDTCLKILEFSPDATLSLRAASRALKLNAEEFLNSKKTEIVRLASHGVGKVDQLLIDCIRAHVNAHDRKTTSPYPLPCHRDLLFHVSLRRQMLALGASLEACRDIVTTPLQVYEFSDQIQTIQDHNLKLIWGRRHRTIISFYRQLAGLPGTDVFAQEVRAWIDANPHLMQLGKADLNSLALTTVPREILRAMNGKPPESDQRLNELDLSDNRLVSLPMNLFDGLGMLKALSLNNNQITSFPDNSFRSLTQLQSLILSNNRLTTLPPTLFQGLIRLRWLILDNNQLTTLPDALFLGLTALEMLSLSHNQLTTLPPFLLHPLVRLEELSLSYNPLTTVPENLLQNQSRLERLSLDHNQDLLILFTNPPAQVNHLPFRDMMHEFYTYNCRSPFAEFYQHVAADRFPHLIRRDFATLDPAIKNGILRRVSENLQDENHAFDDMRIFQRALKRYVRESYNTRDKSQEMRVHARVQMLAQEQRGTASNSREAYVFYNILRLIDAIDQEQLWLK